MPDEANSARPSRDVQTANGEKARRGRGRPRREDDYERIGAHIPGDVAHRLRRHVAVHGRSISDVVAEALRAALPSEEEMRAA